MSNQRRSRDAKPESAPVAAESTRIEARPFTTKAQPATPNIQPHTAPANVGHDFGQVQAPATSLRIQAKLTVSQPGDQYEQEAERVAVSVVRQIDTGVGGGQAQANAQS